MNHLGTRISLLIVVGHGHAVELGLRTVAAQHATGIFPRDGATRLHLRPREPAVPAPQMTALRYQIQHAALALGIAGIPILNGTVLHLGILLYHYLHNGSMQLVFVAHRSRASLQITYVSIIVADNKGAFKLARSSGVDAEIGAQLHGATNTLGDINERAVREDCRVKGCKEVVPVRHHAAQVFAHQFGVFLHGLADGAEDDTLLLQLLAEGSLNAHRVHHSIHRRSSQRHTFLQGDAQLIEGLHQLGVYFSGIPGISGISGRGIGVVADVLIIYLGHLQVSPCGSLQRLPVAERLQSELQQPLGFPLLLGD